MKRRGEAAIGWDTHQAPDCFCFSKFWTRNRPGDKMRDRYNLNLLPGMSEDGLEYGELQHTWGHARWASES